MTDKIFFDGVEYISSVEAGREFGVTNDYITQFCRKGEIQAKQAGQRWYISRPSLQSFFLSIETAKNRRSEELSRKRIDEYRTFNPIPQEGRFSHAGSYQDSANVPSYLAVFAVVILLAGGLFSFAENSHGRLFAGSSSVPKGQVASATISLPSVSTSSNPVSGETASGSQVSTSTSSIPPQTSAPKVVIERIVENTLPAYTIANNSITQEMLDARLNEIENKLTSQIYSLSASIANAPGTLPATGGYTNNIALTQRIDNLNGTHITNATISGGTISGVSLGASDLSGTVGISNGGTGTSTAPTYGQVLLGNSSGTYDLVSTSSLGIVGGGGGGSDPFTHPSATISATTTLLQFFGGASTTLLSANKAYFGGTATTTIDSGGNLLVAGSTTLQNFTALNATTSNATSTSSFANSMLANAASFGQTGTTTITSAGFLGVGTTTPWGLLSINPNGISGPSLVVGSSTATKFIIDNAGNVGIGTTTPFRKFSLSDTVSTAQAAIAYDTTRYAELRVDSNGDFNIGASGNDTFFNNDNLWICTGGSFTVNGCPSGAPTGQGNLFVENKVGIGTTTPNWPLQVAGTRPSLAITDANAGTDLKHWLFSSMNGLLYIGTSTDAYATTSTAAITITNAGLVGIGTSSPTTLLSVGGLLSVGASSTGQLATMGTATSTFNGDVKITGKLDVATIDPVYSIDGTKYATYGAAQVGIKEEVSLKVALSKWDERKKMYVYPIDFDTLEKGSDLWLFYQVTDFGKNWENLVVTLTPGFDGRVFYEEDIQKGVLSIYASEQGPVSVRLVANRFDFTKWKNLRPDQDDSFTHFELNSK